MLSQCCVYTTTEKRAKASAAPEETRLPLHTNMSPAKSNTGALCEKHARELNLDHPPIHYDTSVCSCSNCNSFDCFALRNKGTCLCNQTTKSQPISETNNITNKLPKKSSDKIDKLPKTESVLKERVKKEITYEYNISDVATVKKHSKYSYNYCVPEFNNKDNSDDKRIEISTERLAHSHSAFISYSRQKFDTNTAKLSAQIMNVPYKDFKESISYHKPEIAPPKAMKISRYDILRRIKEAYKACSCKVCECLIGKTTERNEFCKCKPCECDDCKTFMKNIDYKGNIKQSYLGCPCIRCDRKSECKGVVKKGPQAYCDCDSSQSFDCSDSFSKPCNCQPCECIECRSYSDPEARRCTLVVASMREDVPRAYCQCSPCDCAECDQDYTMASSLRREIGTGINRPVSCSCDTCMNQSCETHDSNSCICDIQKRLMRKPIEKDTRDYDIHRASVKKNATERKSKSKNDTIAMFAAVGNSFPKFKHNFCSCGDCKCIVCSCKGNASVALKKKSSNHRRIRACKCSSCECVICDSSHKDFTHRKKNCACTICDCLKCDGISRPSTSNDERLTGVYKYHSNIPSNSCKCAFCECTDSQKMMYRCTGDSCYCTNCKRQMCADQTKFINETVYRNKDDDLRDTSLTCGNITDGNSNSNDGKILLIKLSHERGRITQKKSSKHSGKYSESTDVDVLKHSPVRKSTQVLIASNTAIKEQKCETYEQSKEKNLVKSFVRTSEYESSRSFMSDNSSSNVQPNGNSVVYHQKHTRKVRDNEKLQNSAHKWTLMNFPVKTCLNNYSGVSLDINDTDGYQNINLTRNNVNITYPNCDMHLREDVSSENIDINNDVKELREMVDPTKNAYSALSKKNDLTNKYQEITNVKDLSFHLVASLKNANERISTLINPRLSYYHPKLSQPKVDMLLTKKVNMRKDNITNTNSCEYSKLLTNSYPECHENVFTDMEIDYDKVKRTLQQAKAFSVELTKVLKDYKRANKTLDSKSFKITAIYNTSFNIKESHINNDIEFNKSTDSRCIKREILGESLDRVINKTAYDPVKKYGSHNLNVMTANQEIYDTDYQTTNVESSINSHKNIIISHDVDNDINKHASASMERDMQRQVSLKLGHNNVLLNKSSSSLNKYHEYRLQPLKSSCEQSNDTSSDRHKSRSDKTQNNIKSGQKLRLPRSVILYKKLKLKEALVNLACSTGKIRPDKMVSQSIQYDNREKIINADETTQHKTSFSEDKRETTSTSTDAGRQETSRFGQQNINRWSIMKKNCLITSPYKQDRRYSSMPPLILEVKNTLRTISGQAGVSSSDVGNEVTVTGHGNRVLSKLDLELNDFKIASSQTCNMTGSVERAVDCMDSAFSVVKEGGCDTLKVKFLGLRRVSDHTVLVKWKAPRDVTTVQGYELLVDGRAVQKILSPTRCMAVVTCLPHIEKVLITIRTLVPEAPRRTHYPSATIVYRTRTK